MEKYMKTFELLEATGLNWGVVKERLVTESGIMTEGYGVIRSDNDKCLGVVGKNYLPVQNSELAELVIEASNTIGLEAATGGLLSGGQRVYLQVALPEVNVGVGGVTRYLTAMNSHDGSSAVGFGSTTTVIKCANTYYRALRAASMNKVRHTATAHEKLQAMVDDMKLAIDQEYQLVKNYERMADTKLDEKTAQGVFETIIKRCFGISPLDDIGTAKQNKLEKLGNSMLVETEIEGPTMWALFNGVTRYTNHVAPRAGRTKEYVMVGAGARANDASYDIIVDWMNEHGTRTYIMN